MSALVVCESLHGGTRRVAEEVARGAATRVRTDLFDVADAPAEIDPGVRLLVVGAPTHRYGLSRPSEHPEPPAPLDGAPAAGGGALWAWIDAVRVGAGTEVAAFDTRRAHPPEAGSAARVALQLLRRRGLWALAVPQQFAVEGGAGPPDDEEVARAFAWGRVLGALAAGPAPDPAEDDDVRPPRRPPRRAPRRAPGAPGRVPGAPAGRARPARGQHLG